MVGAVACRVSPVGEHQLFDRRPHCSKRPCCSPPMVLYRPISLAFAGLGMRIAALPMRGVRARRSGVHVNALATELTREARPRREIPGDDFRYTTDVGIAPVPLWESKNIADDPRIHNPLQRLERMGCGWLGVIFEWDGVIVEDDPELERQAWVMLAREEGKSPPPEFVLRRVEGMKNEQAVSEVLCWSRDTSELRRLSGRKEDIHSDLRRRENASFRIRTGSREFLATLVNYKIPIAVASTRPRKVIEEAIDATGVRSFFQVVVAAEDVYRGKPDPEMFIYAAQLLRFIPQRCIVFGNSNKTVEAAHEGRMKCIAVASKHPVYELSAADLVVRHLDELSLVDLKNLSDIDSPEFQTEPEPEMEEEDDPSAHSSVAVDDIF